MLEGFCCSLTLILVAHFVFFISDYVASQHTSSTEMVTSETDYDLRILTPIAPPLQCSE